MAKPNIERSDMAASPKPENITVDSCRSCSTAYLYLIPKEGYVTILTGIPSKNLKYKAISHVWGPYNFVDICCKKCSTVTPIRLRSATTFRNIMALAGSGNSIWMDNMSIDQNDPNDVAAQLAVMGDIYSHAACVSVMLPPSDGKAYEKMAEILSKATTLLTRKGQFDYNPEDGDWNPNPGEGIAATGDLARKFCESMKSFQEELSESKYEYWTRAWTFQEWATSFDVEIGQDNSERALLPLRRVKSSIVYVAIMIANYKLRYGQYTLMNLGFSRGFCRPFLDNIKRLFPFEEKYFTPEEVSEADIRYQTALPNEGTEAILGLRPKSRDARKRETQFRARLNLMLDSFGSGSPRKATFEADLVCCWASMCNISYGYSKEDTVGIALTKIIRALRAMGLNVYNFISNEGSDQDVDVKFFQYAYSHIQSNATNGGLFAGLPVFTGRADTVIHFRTSVLRVKEETKDISSKRKISSTRIKGAEFAALVTLDNTVAALNMFKLATSGTCEGFTFTNILADLATVLEKVPPGDLQTRILVIVSIPLGNGQDTSSFNAWAVCSAADMVDVDSIYVAREDLNGTLVLVKQISEGAVPNQKDGTNDASILAYLTITDQECGTFLLPVSQKGEINLLFRTPQRPDIVYSGLNRDRKFSATLTLEDSDRSSEEPAVTFNGDMPLITGCKFSWDVLECKIEKGKLQLSTNDDVVEQIGEDAELATDALKEFCRRSNNDTGDAAGTAFDRDRGQLNIDIGHPELIDQKEDEANKQRYLKTLRRASF